jgi:hypothetical protein
VCVCVYKASLKGLCKNVVITVIEAFKNYLCIDV